MIDDWRGLYRKGWNGNLIPEAFSHPAKVSFGLAERIYQHMAEEGWIEPGSVVIDPFGGIGGCAFHAMKHGCNWIGVELEPKFVDLGNQNIAFWNKRYAVMPGWGTARLVQGDSRKLMEIIGDAGALVSSPPFSDGEQPTASQSRQIKDYHAFTRGDGTKYDHQMLSPGNLGNMRGTAAGLSAAVSSPPYADGCAHTGGDTPTSAEHIQGGEIHLPGISGVVSSPPYADGLGHGGTPTRGDEHEDDTNLDGMQNGYGSTPGQLGAMPARGFEASVSSPPYIPKDDRRVAWGHDHEGLQHEDERRGYKPVTTFRGSYSNDPRNLGNPTGADQADFWLAARQIVDQVYAALAPDGHAVWIVKSFVKNKQRVDFPGQWQQMCEAAGFVTLHEHRAWLVEHKGAQYDMEGGLIERKTERKSFFRRLAENKGSPRIDWEVVQCMVKPQK